MEELVKMRRTLQVSMNILGAFTAGMEEALGEPAKNVSYLAGERLGMKMAAGAEKTDDIEKALAEVNRVLAENDCLWGFEPFKEKAEKSLIRKTETGEEMLLVFRDCMIRQSLYCYGHNQKGSLCNMMFGFFAGALRVIMGRNSTLEIIHAGENACLKKLTIQRAQTGETTATGRRRARKSGGKRGRSRRAR